MFLLLAHASVADGEELEDEVQELFLGDLAFPQEALELQISVESTWLEEDGSNLFGPLVVAELGVTDRLQLEVEAPFIVSVPVEGPATGGLGNAEVGALYNALRSPSLGLLVSAGVAATLPTAQTELVDRAHGGAALVSVYKTIGALHASLSAATEIDVAEDDAELGGEVALGLLVPLGAVVPIAEIAIEREEDDSQLRLAAGLALHATDAIEIGLAGLVGADWGAVVNLTWERSLVED